MINLKKGKRRKQKVKRNNKFYSQDKNMASEKIKKFLNKRSTKIILIAVLTIGLVVTISYFVFKDDSVDQNSEINSNVSESLEPRVLDGVMVEKDKTNRYPFAVMVENLSTVRPQSGLDKAGIVYEALAEGGITRFLAIYTTADEIKEIGPVRSARPYYLDWVAEYSPLYAHAGGSPDAIRLLQQIDNIINLDQIGGQHAYFWRDASRSTASEHTLFTSSELLTYALRDNEAPEEGDYEPWLFKAEKTASQRVNEAKKISIDYSTFSYKVDYQYDFANNRYMRLNGDVPHTDFVTGNQLFAKNVIVQYVKTRIADSPRLAMDTIGEGGALLFQDGEMINATWEKEDVSGRTRFYSADGQEIELNPGPTWIQIVPTDRTVEYN
ncbi:MAG: DUF3048 domain-containing protein [Patescibacteria group bacterium]|jgi:hypothetical protein